MCNFTKKNKKPHLRSFVMISAFSLECMAYICLFFSFLACNSLMKTKMKPWWFYSLILRASYPVKNRCKCTWKWLSTLLTQSEVLLRLLLPISLFLCCCSSSICPQESLVSSQARDSAQFLSPPL